MGSTHTQNATARTTISYMKGIDMNKLMEELVKEYEASRPPKEAVTVRTFAEQLKNVSMTNARIFLDKKVKDDGWLTKKFQGVKHYWEP